MEPFKIKKVKTVFIGVTWTLFSSVIGYFLIANNNQIHKQEIKVQNFLMALRPQKKPPTEILVLKAQDSKRIQDQGLDVNLARKILEKGAAVVIINYPEQTLKIESIQAKYQEENNQQKNLESPSRKLTELIKEYRERVVLVAPIKPTSNSTPPELENPGQYLFDEEKYQPFVEPNSVKGFFEYDENSKSQDNLNSPVRIPRLLQNLKRPDLEENDPNKIEQFQSASLLALNKYIAFLNKQNNFPKAKEIPSSFLVNYWKAGSFEPNIISTLKVKSSTIKKSEQILVTQINKIDNGVQQDIKEPEIFTIDYFCQPKPFQPEVGKDLKDNNLAENECEINNSDVKLIENKIILISSASEEQSMTMKSPVGELPAVEVQANILANLLTTSWFQTVPNNLQLGLIVLIAVSTTGAIIFTSSKSSTNTNKWAIILAIEIGGYGTLVLASVSMGWILPVMPLLALLVPGISVPALLLIHGLLEDKEQKQHQIAERKAVLSQTKKLLYRIASDVHDDPLQELSLAIRQVSIFELDHPDFNGEPVVNKLTYVGRQIRSQLNNIRTIAEKLEVTPELKNGLDKGIRDYLRKRQQSGELTLEVIDEIKPLPEPTLDSHWLDVREDIYRFFQEAIHNVIRHGQIQGRATQVKVCLFSKASICTLEVVNDGDTHSNPSFKSKNGGYGTKIMETVAKEIPNGRWERVALASGGVSVKLNWTLRANSQEK